MITTPRHILRKRVRLLSKRKLYPQKSPEWFMQRQKKITASEAASCLFKTQEDCSGYLEHFKTSYKMNGKGLNSFKSREEFIISKCLEFYGKSQYTDNHSTLHGKRFEDVASKFYCNLRDTSIIEFGLLDHSKLDWIGASPDGITAEGVMLEIKCPNVRRIKPDEFPIYYWVQMQIQLEVCDLDECDYIECDIRQVSEEDFYDIPDDKYPGFILVKPGTEEYIYPPFDVVTVIEHLVWFATQDQSLECVFYYIEKYQLLNVKRDRVWFKHVEPKLKETFDIINKFQNDKDAWDKHYAEYLGVKNKKFNDYFESSTCMIDIDIDDIDDTDTGKPFDSYFSINNDTDNGTDTDTNTNN